MALSMILTAILWLWCDFIDEMDIYRQTLDMEELGQLYQLTKTISSLNALRIRIKGYFFVFIAS